MRYLGDRPNALLVVDPVRPDATELAALLDRASSQGVRLIAIGADRWNDRYHARRVLNARFTVGIETNVFVEPTSALWASVVRRRQKAGRLGILEPMSNRARSYHFVQHRHNLYSSLASLEDAEGFISRGVEVLTALEPGVRRVFAALGVMACADLDAPLSVLAAVSGLPIRKVAEVCRPGGEIAEWVTSDGQETGFVRLRHGYLGDLILEGAGRSVHRVDLAGLVQDFLVTISDRIGPGSMRRRDYFARAAGQLMDIAFVRRIVGQDDVDDWYEALQPLYGWNARYWEQRALGLPDNLAKATSYARRAIKQHEDAFTLNTLATVLMRRAAHSKTKEGSRRGYWLEAEGNLVKSRQDGRGRFEFPYVTFFQHTHRVMDTADSIGPEWASEIELAVRSWVKSLLASGIGVEGELRDLIERFPAEWRTALPASDRRQRRQRKPNGVPSGGPRESSRPAAT